VCRGHQRTWLVECLEKNPETLMFSYNHEGKLRLDGSSIRFNLSHSGRFALFAVTWFTGVGVDMREMRADGDYDRSAGRVFAPGEASLVHEALQSMKKDLFFKIWTYKEAYIKGKGKGLSIPLNQFAVDPLEEVSRLQSHENPEET